MGMAYVPTSLTGPKLYLSGFDNNQNLQGYWCRHLEDLRDADPYLQLAERGASPIHQLVNME